MILFLKRSVFHLSFSTAVIFLLVDQLLADCPSFSHLDKGCKVNDDCTKITCSERFVQKDITFSLDIDKCAEPVTVTAKMNVPNLGIYWSHKYTSNDKVAVPGFTVNLPFVSGGVYVQVTLDSRTSNLQIKVKLLAGASILGQESYPVQLTILDDYLPISNSDCGILEWWKNLALVWKIVIPTAVLIFFIIVVWVLASLCCPKQRQPRVNQMISLQPAAVVPPLMVTTSEAAPKPLRDDLA